MKKYWLIIILFFIFINVNALTVEQQNNIIDYAKEFIEKGNMRKAKDGTPLLKYGSSDSRLPAFSGKLYNGHFVFNCDSFVSYVLYNTYGFPVMNGSKPYTVSWYEHGPERTNYMTKISKGSYNSIIKDLVKGDVIVAFDGNGESAHVMLYAGDGYIAHAIRKGLTVQTFASYDGKYHTYMIVRLKETGAKKSVDMSVTWPDTNEKEILGIDNYPKFDFVYDNNKKVQEGHLILNIEDDKKIDSYSISNNSLINWIAINKIKEKVDYVIKENGSYTINVKDSKGQITTKKLEINNIDNLVPVINNIKYHYNGDNTYNLTIDASDDNPIKYRLNNNYQDSNLFNNLSLKKYQLIIEDEVNNQKIVELNLDNAPIFNIEYANEYCQSLNIDIIPQNRDNIQSYAIQKELNDNVSWLTYNNDLNYLINENGTYYIWLLSKDNIPYYRSITIDLIDNDKPIINDYKINKKLNSFDLIINASDK